MEEPSHHHCHAIELKSSKKIDKKIKRKKRPSLQIILLHAVMSCSCRLEAWKELHMYPLKTNDHLGLA